MRGNRCKVAILALLGVRKCQRSSSQTHFLIQAIAGNFGSIAAGLPLSNLHRRH